MKSLPTSCIIVVWLTVGAVVLATVVGCGASSGPTRPSDQSVRTTSCDQLIDRFVTISSEDYGVQTNILNTPGNPTEKQEGLLPLGPRQVKPSEAMEELVRRGFESISPLVRHIDDARPTQFKIVNEDMTFMSMAASNEYDYNARTTAEPAGVNLGKHFDNPEESAEELGSHVLTVGDVCFKVLGQIVGRRYDPIRYQPSLCLKINSPTHSPALAKAVRDEWGMLTPEQHKQKLVQDLLQPDRTDRETLAIETLARYYPEAAEEPVIKRLQLPLYDRQPVLHLYLNFEKQNRQQRRAACKQFVKERGPLYYDALRVFLTATRDDDWARIIADAFPEYDPGKRFYADIHSYGELGGLIDCLAYTNLHTPRLDAYVYKLFQEAVKDSDPKRGEYIACACVGYLAGRGHDAEFLAYCQERLKSPRYQQLLERAIEKLTGIKAPERTPDIGPLAPAPTRAPATLPASAALPASQFTTVSLRDFFDAREALESNLDAWQQYASRLAGKEVTGSGIVEAAQINPQGDLAIHIRIEGNYAIYNRLLVLFGKDTPERKMRVVEGDRVEVTGRFDDVVDASAGFATGIRLKIIAPATRP